ncbi:hypothetical protein BJX96DRAFT_102720 [Aspergillus floccosus]
MIIDRGACIVTGKTDTYRPDSRTLPASTALTMFVSSFPQCLEAVARSVAAAQALELFVQNKAFIDGLWVSKEQTFRVYEPSTAQVLGTVADCDVDDIRLAIQSANLAQESYYSSTTAAQRGALLRKWHVLIMENVESRKCMLKDGTDAVRSLTVISSWKNPVPGAPELSAYRRSACRSMAFLCCNNSHRSVFPHHTAWVSGI